MAQLLKIQNANGEVRYVTPKAKLAEGDTIVGIGDVIAWITNKLGITSCGGCKSRQAKLNKLLPITRSHNGS